MNLDELRKAADKGSVDTVLLTIADMEGRLQGKRLTTGHFLDEVVEHHAEGCNYLLAVDVDMNTVDGYAMSSWERGYGDFVMKPDMDTLRPVPWHEGTVLVMADLGGRTTRTWSPRRARSCAASWRGSPSAAGGPRPARSSSSSCSATATRTRWRKAYRDLEPGQPLQRRLLDDRDRAGGAADPAHPQLDDRRRHARGELEGRVQLRPARDQLPLRRGAGDRGRPRHLQERREGDRRPGGHVDHLHGEARRARGQLMSHPLLAHAGRRRQRVRRRPGRPSTISWPASSLPCAS